MQHVGPSAVQQVELGVGPSIGGYPDPPAGEGEGCVHMPSMARSGPVVTKTCSMQPSRHRRNLRPAAVPRRRRRPASRAAPRWFSDSGPCPRHGLSGPPGV